MAELRSTSLILLAAGLSRRYGTVGKLVASFRGKPLAAHIADTAAEMEFSRRIAVCRPGDDDLAELLEKRGFLIVLNPDTARGLSSSLALGVEAAVAPRTEAVLVALADMPFVTASHLAGLVGGLGHASAVGSAEAGQPTMPPAAFAAEHFAALMALQGDRGARDLLQGAAVLRAADGMLADFDTPADFARL